MRYRELTVKMVSLFITPDLVYTALIRYIPGIGLLKLPVYVMNTGLSAYLIKRAHPHIVRTGFMAENCLKPL